MTKQCKSKGGRPCIICSHSDRPKIEALIRAGLSLIAVAKEIPGLTPRMVQNHREKHMTAKEQLIAKISAQPNLPPEVAAFDLDANLRGLYDRVDSLLTAAETGKDQRIALGAIKELRSTMELMARAASTMKGDSHKDGLHFTRSKEWVVVMDFFAKHPQLRDEFLIELRATGSKVEDDVTDA